MLSSLFEKMPTSLVGSIPAQSSLYSGLGIDTTEYLSEGDVKCLVYNGYSYIIVVGYRSYGQVDMHAAQNVKNAWDGGMKSVDVSLFPCVTCGNPKDQATALVEALKGLQYGTIWIIIEKLKWSSRLINIKFILEMVDQLKRLNQNVGIYTNSTNWESIMGD